MNVFIPIKHNSQRVPQKNFRLINEEPLYKHVLLKFSDFKVYVDTDSGEIYHQIKEDERLSHVTVYKRRDDLKGDEISVCELIKNFIFRYDIASPVAQIHVTSPFLSSDTLRDACRYIKNYDSVVSCTSHQSRFWRKEEYGMCPINHNPVKIEQTQDLPVFYEENSAFYVFKPEVITSYGSRIGKNPYFYDLTEPENIDIDTEADWEKCIRRFDEKHKNIYRNL